MIHHFPNFVCWSAIFEAYDGERDLLYLDTLSCLVAGYMIGVKGFYFSGPQMAHSLLGDEASDLYYLLAEDSFRIAASRRYVLPFKESFESDTDVLVFLQSVPRNAKLVIGISSPKQNSLARYLHSIRSDIDYFCLGAAVSQTWATSYGNTALRGTGLQWLEFLYAAPARTLSKLSSTVTGFMRMICSPTERKLYREFVKATCRSAPALRED